VADGLNRVQLFGNLGADPELRTTSSGQSVLKLRLATSSSYLDRNTNQRKERVEWHSVTVWGKRAEALAKFLSKGSRLLVEGELRTSSYEATDGSGKRYRTEINALNIILAGGGQRNEARGGYDNRNQPEDDYPRGDDAGDDDIPF
jgi:single-strand DNA-binding protein